MGFTTRVQASQKAVHSHEARGWGGEAQLGVQGILVLDARRGGPAQKAGVQGTSRDNNGRLVLGDIITRFNGKIIKWAPSQATLSGDRLEIACAAQDLYTLPGPLLLPFLCLARPCKSGCIELVCSCMILQLACTQADRRAWIAGIIIINPRTFFVWESWRDESGEASPDCEDTASPGSRLPMSGTLGRRTASDLYKQLDLCKVGDDAVMEVLRDTSKEQLHILLEASS